jgi:hypothetical protein
MLQARSSVAVHALVSYWPEAHAPEHASHDSAPAVPWNWPAAQTTQGLAEPT